MKVNEKYTLINIESTNSFYTNMFNKNSNKNNNIDNIDILDTVYFTSIIKNSVVNLIKDFNNIYYIDNQYFKGSTLYNMLLQKYNLNLNLSYHNFKVICNALNQRDKILSYDLSNKDIINLRLYDLQYYNKKSKINLLYKEIKGHIIVILNIVGNDKIYNILLVNYKKDILKTNRIIQINNKRDNQRLIKFYKDNKYSYQKCKIKILRKKEREITKGQKYSHNFKNNDYKNYKNHNNYIDLIVNDLLYYYDNKDKFNDNIEKNYYDLIDLYYNKYDLIDLKNDLIDLKNYLFDKSKNDYNNNFNIDFLTNSKKIKCIKIFIDIIDIYDYRITKEDIKSSLNDYDNYNYNLKDYFLYYKTNDKI